MNLHTNVRGMRSQGSRLIKNEKQLKLINKSFHVETVAVVVVIYLPKRPFSCHIDRASRSRAY